MITLQKFSIANFDWKLFGAVLLLVAIGLAAIYSVDLSRGAELVFFKKQLVASSIGIFILFGASFTHCAFWRHTAKWWYLLSFLLLILVLIFGTTIRGTRGWFDLSFFSVQPVEIAKIGLILIMAHIIARFGRQFERPLFFFGTAIVSFALVFLVILQPDLGSAVLLVAIWFGLTWMVGSRRLFIMLFILGVLLLGIFGWFFLLKDYQKERLSTFVNPSSDPLRSGYNATQSIIAVGAGKVLGRGLGFGSQSQLRFLPEAQTDFIFSVIGEELGLAGVMAILALFGVIFWRLFVIIKKTNDDFIAIIACGVLILFFTQMFTNISACIGLLPITGVTLPFVSYGGSSIVISMLMIGIVESMVGEKH
jgi:rod shape determining protein RodA